VNGLLAEQCVNVVIRDTVLFEHPTKTWACATHKQFTMQTVAVAITKATWNWVRGKCEKAMREVLGAGRGVQAGDTGDGSRGGKRDEAGCRER
jgi:hypothetical protein